LAKALMEFETLSGDELVGLLQGVRPVRDTGDKDPPPAPRAAVPAAGKSRGATLGPDAGGLEPQPQT
jgi:cell division protease FtsH